MKGLIDTNLYGEEALAVGGSDMELATYSISAAKI